MDLCDGCKAGSGVFDMDRLCCSCRHIATMPLSYRRVRAEIQSKRLGVRLADMEDGIRYFMRMQRAGKIDGR